jgi:hypothetical protein
MKNSSDTIGNQTRDTPACNATPQPSKPPRCALHAPRLYKSADKIVVLLYVRTEGADINDITELFREINALLTCFRT